jgi:hypothetical protein
MNPINLKDIIQYVEENITTFHGKRLTALEKIKLTKILHRKNIYLFKAKNILTTQDLVKNLLDAFLQSQEETMFGDFLEGLAIFICSKVYGGVKSKLIGVDLEFEKDNIIYLIEIKSGPYWANSSQIKKMKENFIIAKKIIAKEKLFKNKEIIAVNGCCYGRENKYDKGDYLKLCGQRFWELISGNSQLYLEIIDPLGHKAKQKNEEFLEAYSEIINRFTFEFTKEFCDNGKINWEKLVKFNSSV